MLIITIRSGLEYPVAINKINEFEKNNKDIAVNVLGVQGQRIYPITISKHYDRKKVVNLLLITDGEKKHYTTIKSSSRLLAGSNSKHKCKQYFCPNCLQGFHSEESRDKHHEYCEDNEVVRIEIPKEGSIVEFHDWQNQIKAPFIMNTDFESILKPKKIIKTEQKVSYIKEIINTSPVVSV